MVFMCQKDSFLKEFEATVLSCSSVNDEEELKAAGIDLAKTDPTKIFRVILDDTIIFPEGGGQPDDKGKINEVEVVRSIRKGAQALHYVTIAPSEKQTNGIPITPVESSQACPPLFKEGEKVLAQIDWKRRFDHMQQHSGQHLITAVADELFGFSTTSWWLGSEESNIELDTKDITSEQIEKIECVVNEKIRAGIPVTVDVVELDDPKLKTARGRNLPDDVQGQIRIVTMAGVESNVCCGTHVANLSQLQIIKLLHVIKKKGKCLLHFLCGNRVIDRFSRQYLREQQLTGILNSSPAELPGAAEKLNIALKTARKSALVLGKDLAALEAKQIKVAGIPKFWAYHRDNVDLDFALALLREIGDVKNSVILVTIKTEGSSGHMMLRSELEKEKLISLGDSLCEILDGKGNVRGNTYQAKVNKITNVKKAVKIAQEFVENSKP